MTYSTGDKPSSLSENLVQALDNINGLHPGFRPAHAKGIMFSGTFTPAPEAVSLTRAPHLQQKSTPVTVRFSNSAGIPDIADNHSQGASPRGIAIRFHLADHVHTDIIAHSHNGFPVRTPEEFLEMLQAAAASASRAVRKSTRCWGRWMGASRRAACSMRQPGLRVRSAPRRERLDERGAATPFGPRAEEVLPVQDRLVQIGLQAGGR